MSSRKVSSKQLQEERDLTSNASGGAKKERILDGRLLKILPLFLVPGLLATLATGRFRDALFLLIGIGVIFGSAWLVRTGIVQAGRVEAGSIEGLHSVLPRKLLGAIGCGIGMLFASATVSHYGFGMAILYGVITTGLVLLRYGFDPKMDRSRAVEIAEGSGIDIKDLLRQLRDGRSKVETIRANGSKINDRATQRQVAHIADLADDVLNKIETDPRDIRRSRRFLVSYLDRAADATGRYANGQETLKGSELDEKFHDVLNDLETVFKDQNRLLEEEDSMDLEIKLDVLSKRLTLEGAG